MQKLTYLKNKQKNTFVITNMRNVKKQSHLIYIMQKKFSVMHVVLSPAHSVTVKRSLSQKLTRDIKTLTLKLNIQNLFNYSQYATSII